ncbi:MAG TPA: hypothetical protein VL651_06755 [Bacteroidia bacterium]|jgi:hypothetical protein|nr:hypothetical protein [Bacteroidia bacterium]
MDKYNINRNRDPLTPEDVQKGKDFDTFMKAYSARPKPFWGSKTMYMSIATVGIIAVVAGTWVVMNNSESTTPTENPKTAFVTPPLEGLDVKDTTYFVDAAAGADFIYKTGSFIHVPQNAFVDSAGNPVSGKVEIHYREFHNTAEIFLAGIPMTYDSAGSRYHFESAGMLEITAWQNGRPLKVNSASQINVAMASDTADQKYNVYYLDTTAKNWNFIAKDKAVVAGFVADSTKTKPLSVADVAPPVLPSKADKAKHSFVIAFEPSEFPELSVYKGVRFQVDETKTPYNKKDKNIQWEDVNIARNADRKSYTVTFMQGANKSTYVTGVVVDEANYAGAMKVYNQKYEEYQTALKKKQDDILTAMSNHENQLMNADARRIFVNDSVLSMAMAARRANVGDAKENMVMREFIIRNFGIWNSDCPASLPQGPEMFVQFIDSKTKKEIQLSRVFLVEKGKNAIWTFYASDFAKFRFNHDAENLVWAMTSDGKLAVVSTDAITKGLDDMAKAKGDDKDKKLKLEMEVASSSTLTGVQASLMLGI